MRRNLLSGRTHIPLHTGDASPCSGLWSPRIRLMPTAPSTMLATPRPTSTTDSKSRLHRILRLEHIFPRASLKLQQETAEEEDGEEQVENEDAEEEEESPLPGARWMMRWYCCRCSVVVYKHI